MILFPAIDLYEKKAVRLYKGNYAEMTVYNENPLAVALDFVKAGAKQIHLVDLEGAKDGTTPNLSVVKEIVEKTDLFVEIGGGVRNLDVVKKYLSIGVDRVILGTAAVKDPDFLKEAVAQYGDKIAVGVDLKDGFVAIKGWTEVSGEDAFSFCEKMAKIGVQTIICTDISKDGAMQGANHDLYQKLSERFSLNFVASGGVSNMKDVVRLRDMGLYGAIIGKAYYVGAVDLKQAIEVSR